MDAIHGPVGRAAAWVHHNLLWLLVGCYVVAAVAPAPGLALRAVRLGGGHPVDLSLPALMLGFLLFNAGLGIEFGRLAALARRPTPLLAGLVANLVVPVGFILLASQTLHSWHNPAEAQDILVGLALVASMPIAGSSTAWSQNADGDLALSLGLIVLSTLLSPVTTPAVLTAVGWVAEGEYAAALRGLAAGGTGVFLGLFVLLPSVAGMAARAAVPEARLVRVRPGLKLANSAVLLGLMYSNAAVALPGLVADPDWDFLAVLTPIVALFCGATFLAGWAVGRGVGADRRGRASLIFGLGMNNNGTGMVLAAAALADLPNVMLPIILYNLLQHVAAGITDRLLGDRPGRE